MLWLVSTVRATYQAVTLPYETNFVAAVTSRTLLYARDRSGEGLAQPARRTLCRFEWVTCRVIPRSQSAARI